MHSIEQITCGGSHGSDSDRHWDHRGRSVRLRGTPSAWMIGLAPNKPDALPISNRHRAGVPVDSEIWPRYSEPLHAHNDSPCPEANDRTRPRVLNLQLNRMPRQTRIMRTPLAPQVPSGVLRRRQQCWRAASNRLRTSMTCESAITCPGTVDRHHSSSYRSLVTQHPQLLPTATSRRTKRRSPSVPRVVANAQQPTGRMGRLTSG